VIHTKSLIQEIVDRGYGERLLQNEPMTRYTTYGIGGPADMLIATSSISELQELVGLARSCSLPVIVIGEGSNILVADAGVRGLVVVNH